MKRLLLVYFLFSTFAASAQLTNENFDSYTVGAFDAQWNPSNWVGWFGVTSNVDIDNTFARSAPNSMLVNSATDDVVALLGTLDNGTYEITFYQYIPTGFGGYFNIQHNYTNTAGDWAAEVYFGDNSTARIVTDGSNYNFMPIYDQWVECKMEFNFQADVANFYYNGTLIHTWQVTTNAAGGGVGLNQVNGINFYGACDGVNCLTTAYYDDITVVQTAIPAQYDATVLTKPEPMPYTQIPDSLMTEMTFSAEVTNNGTLPVTNLQVEFKVFDGTNTMVHSELSNILPFLNSYATDMVYGSSAYLPTNQSELYTITYDVSIAEIDDNPQNDSDTLLFDVQVTDSTYAKDDGNYTAGIGAAGANAILGQNFEFVEDSRIHSVTTSYAGGVAGDQIRLIIYRADSLTKKPIDDVYTSAPYTLPANGGGIGNETYVTFYVDPILGLDAGLYTFAIEQMAMNDILLSTSTAIYKPQTTVVSIDNATTWSYLEDFAFEVAMNIRPVVSLEPQAPPISTSPIELLELMEITPNPNNGVFMLNVELAQNLPIQIDVFNTNGQLVKAVVKGDYTNIQQRIDLTNEATGIYLVRLQVGNEVITKRVVVD